MADGFNTSMNLDQLAGVVNSLVTANNKIPSLTPVENGCASQNLQVPCPAAESPNTTIRTIPVSFNGLPVSVVPLLVSLNMSDRSLLTISDRNSSERILTTGSMNDKTNSVVYSFANTVRTEPISVPTPIPYPPVPQNVSSIQSDDLALPNVGEVTSLDCPAPNPELHGSSQPTVYTTTNQHLEEGTNLNHHHPDVMSAEATQGSLPPSALVSSDMSALADLRLGLGVSTNQDSLAIQSALSPLLQVAGHFQVSESLQTTQQPIVHSSDAMSMPDCVSSPVVTGVLNNRVNLPSPLNMLPDLREKENENNLTSSSSVPLVAFANMSVIDMILKSHQNDCPPEGKTPECCSEYMRPSFFCLDCNANYCDGCEQHDTTYCHVKDSPPLSKARMSLPGVLELKASSGHSSSLGVWSKESIARKTKFGPLIGEVKNAAEKNDKNDSCGFPVWKLFHHVHGASVLETSDENLSNWMMFVKPARTMAEQNLVAFQQDNSIFFITCKDIPPDQELLIWYSKDYAKTLGAPFKPDLRSCCSVCDKQFPDTKSLSQHLKFAHPDTTVRRWKCHFCMRGFTTTTKLKTHMLTHMGVKPHTCSQCGKQFTDQSNLKMHQSIHTGERKFSCCVCHKLFRQKAHLKSHMFTHTGEKNLKCRFCEKMFSRSSDLKQHEYQHTKEKIFRCSHCEKSFYKTQNFKKHLKIHSGERDYTCPTCSKSFYTKYHLKRHSGTCKGLRTSKVFLNSDASFDLDAVSIMAGSPFKGHGKVLGGKEWKTQNKLAESS